MATGDDLAHTNTWTDEVPADASDADQLGVNIRRQVLDVEERMKAEHYWNGDGDGSTSDDGRHKPGLVSCLDTSVARADEVVGTGQGQIQKFSDEGGIWAWNETDQEWQHVPQRAHVYSSTTDLSVTESYLAVPLNGASTTLSITTAPNEGLIFYVKISVDGADGRITAQLTEDGNEEDLGHLILSLGSGKYQMCQTMLTAAAHGESVNTSVDYQINVKCSSGLSSATINSCKVVVLRYQ